MFGNLFGGGNRPASPPASAPPPSPFSATAMLITESLLRDMFPNLRNPQDFVVPLRMTVDRFEINTPLRIAAFLAQVGHESAGLTALIENLNYSADGLLQTFPRHFPTRAIAESYARQPARIANRAYANRMGNGDEASGDGWRFRGKGGIQITGRNNTTAFATAMKMTPEAAADYMLTPEGAMISAGWFWQTNGCNQLADGNDRQFEALTRRINGGTKGLDDRVARFNRAKRLLKV